MARRLLLIVPLAAALATGCRDRPGARLASLADATLIERFEEMHRPIYRVYSMGTDRDQIHGHLAFSFAGEALSREYVEHFTTLVRMERERTSMDVLRVDYENVELLERRRETVKIDADWIVTGLVTHQGHRHPRMNRYRAVYTLALDASAGTRVWDSAAEALRIVATRVRSAERRRDALTRGDLSTLPRSAAGTLSMEELLRSGLAEELLDAAESQDTETSDPSPPDPP